MGKKRPTVDAILRGIYYSDPPLNLDEGKYENRLQLLKVPRLTKERILRVAPDFHFIKSPNNVLKAGEDINKDITETEFLYNQLTIKIYRSEPTLTKYELLINIRDTSTQADSEILSTHIVQRAKAVIRTFTFNPSHDINYYFRNDGAEDIIIDYTFSYSELDQPYIISLDSRINASTYISKYFTGFNHLINRMRIMLYQAGTLNATITLKQLGNNSAMQDSLVNFTINAGTNYTALYDFRPCSYFSLLVQNDNAGQELSFQIILFFSKNLLESQISLDNLGEKSYNSLTDKPTIPSVNDVAMMELTTTRTQSASAWQKVTEFGTDLESDSSVINADHANDKITVLVAGYYRITCNINMANSLYAPGYTLFAIAKNGTKLTRGYFYMSMDSGGETYKTLCFTTIQLLAINDYIELQESAVSWVGVLQINGTNLIVEKLT